MVKKSFEIKFLIIFVKCFKQSTLNLKLKDKPSTFIFHVNTKIL